MEQNRDWPRRLSASIAAEVRRHRIERGMSTQQLADACAGLGHPIARAVLSNLENGRRENVSIAELLVVAKALDVEPIFLMLPLGYEDTVEILPGQTVETTEAVRWVAGDEGRRWIAAEADLGAATVFQLRQLELLTLQELRDAGEYGLHEEGSEEAIFKEYAEASRLAQLDDLELAKQKADVDRLSRAAQGASLPELLSARSRLADLEAAIEQRREKRMEAGTRYVAAQEWRRTGGVQPLAGRLERVQAELTKRGWRPTISWTELFDVAQEGEG